MAISVAQRLHNVRASLETFIKSTLVDVDGVSVRFPGVPFRTDGLASWCELSYLTKAPRFRYRRVAASTPGQEVGVLFQIVCYVQKKDDATANAYAAETLRDKVFGRLHENVEVSIKNYYGGDTTTVYDTATVVPLGENSVTPDLSSGKGTWPGENLAGYVLTYELRYVEPHSAT